MMTISKHRTHGVGAAAVVAVAVLAAGCGSSAKTTTSTASSAAAATSAASATTSAASSAPSSGALVKVTHGAHGVYLTGASGRALYLWVADKNAQSACSGACAQAWPPLTTKGAPTGSGGVAMAKLTTITRSDGTKQVAYDGHPLYYFAGDTGAGTTTGQGSNSFGAKWWLVAPSGTAITAGAASKGGSGGSGSSSSSSGGWG